MKKIVRREIARNIENKSKQVVVEDQPIYYPLQGALYDTENTIQISPGAAGIGAPDILQGVGNGARIGNKIKIKKATIKGVFVPRQYDVSNNPNPSPHIVRLVLFYDREFDATFPAPRTDFFEFNNTSQGISGDLTDIVGPPNNPKYRVMAQKFFKLGRAAPTTAEQAVGAAEYPNNDYKMNYILNWNVTKYMVQMVQFNDNSAVPTTRGLWMQVMASPATGVVGFAGVIPMQLNYWIDIVYEDA